jgi:hypothetical protein
MLACRLSHSQTVKSCFGHTAACSSRFSTRTGEPTSMHAASAAIPKAEVELTMAITIRNKQLEAEIKALGAKYRKGPTDTVRFLLREHIMREPVDEHASAAEREGKIAELRAEAARTTDEDRRKRRQSIDRMWEERGLPR